VAVFLFMAIGWSRSLGASWPLFVGAVAIASALAAAVTLAGRGLGEPGPDADPSWNTRLTDALAHRDFIYLIVLLSAAGRPGGSSSWWRSDAGVPAPLSGVRPTRSAPELMVA